MEHFISCHRLQAEEKLRVLQTNLPAQFLENQHRLETGYFSIQQTMDIGRKCMKENLAMAACVWQRLLPRVNDREGRSAILNQLFQARLAVGPWTSALETAQMSLEDVLNASNDSSDPSAMQTFLFQAQLNLGTAHRLLKDLDEAESHYHEALCIAQSLQDFDCEAAAKIHLAMCLLDRGQLKEAIDNYFRPLLPVKDKMTPITRTIYLQYYGNASRSAADWGPAKVYLREALKLANQQREPGLLSSCWGDLGNVFRSEGRYNDAEVCHRKHYDIALRRGDLHGLAVACGNIGFLKYYDPKEYETSVVMQVIEYSLAEQVGDFARMAIACNKIGKLYITLGHCEEAVKLFNVAIEGAKRAQNIAGEGMAWGNLGTVYRILGRLDEATKCHLIYRDNASKRLDVGGVAIMQHQLAMDFLLRGDLLEAERSILDCFQTLEKIRSQIGDEDESKISNFEKNRAEAHNLLQVVLTAQGKYKEAFVFSDISRTRALSEIVQKRLSCLKTQPEQTENLSIHPDPDLSFGHARSVELNPANVEEYFRKAVLVSQKLATTLVAYSMVKEFGVTGDHEEWVYIWVLVPSGDLHFTKSRLEAMFNTQVEVNEDRIFSLRGGFAGTSQLQLALRSTPCNRVDKYMKGLLLNVQCFEDLERIEELLGSEDVVLRELSDERKELNANKRDNSTDHELQDHGEMSSKSDVVNLTCGQEKATGESVPCREGPAFHQSRERLNAEEICKNDLSTLKLMTPGDYDIRNLHDVESSNSPYDFHVDIPHAREYIDQQGFSDEKLLTDPGSKAHTPYNAKAIIPEESSSSELELPTSQEDDPVASSTLENSYSQKPVILSNPAGQSSGKEEFIPRDDSTSPPSVSLSDLAFDVHHVNNHGDCEDYSAGKPCYMPNPNVNALCEGHSTSQEHPTVLKTIGSSALGVASQGGNLSTEMPILTLKTDDVDEAGPPNAPSNQNVLSNEDVSGPTASLSKVAVKIDDTCPSEEACQSGKHFANAEEKSVIKKDSETGSWKPLLNSIYRVLIEPIKDILSSEHMDSPRVTFIPQDFLLRVPFAALCEDSDNSYLVENFVISTSPSIHLLDLTADYLNNLQEGSGPEDVSLLAIGNPVMPFEELPSLPASAEEVRMIAEVLDCPQTEIALGSRATKNHVISVMSNFQILHFATHAIVDVSDAHGDFTHRGFIVLAKSDELCNGLLMAEEVKQMSLKAELVVLSCCDTGLGKVTGDGVLGLSRAFIAAGAACVVVTLWKIGDGPTSHLMRYFYQEYKESRDAALALHKAMCNTLGRESTRSPEHWAAFAIIGATGRVHCA